MPSPFPGMDPYLEDPAIWPDFHHAFSAEIRNELNRSLPPPYYDRLEMRTELGIGLDGGGEEGRRRWFIPDVQVVRPPDDPIDRGGGAAVAVEVRREVSPGIEVEPAIPQARHFFVEVRDPSRGHALITLIEILSPSNRRPGPDRDTYAAMQREVLGSDASLIEIDLLRAGRRVVPSDNVALTLARIDPPPLYVVSVNRAWRRDEPGGGTTLYPFGLRDLLPCIPVPLRRGEPEVPLDLQHVVTLTYDTGPYRRGAVDYAQPPTPPLLGDDAPWAAALLRERGLIAPPQI